MKLTYVIAGAAVVLTPFASGASTLEPSLQMRINPGTTEELNFIDNETGDSNGLTGALDVSVGPVSGYEAVSATVIKQEAPPFDRLLADVDVDVGNLGEGPTSIRIEITGRFQNNAAGLWPGSFSATAKDVLGSTWDITSHIGGSAYDQGIGAIIGVSAGGSLFAVNNLIRFNPNDYWITHVFNHAGDGSNVSASASAEFIAPVPVPAAGLLLVGALGGLAALRRRKG